MAAILAVFGSGSGFNIAMRDPGDREPEAGSEQSGHMEAVGVPLCTAKDCSRSGEEARSPYFLLCGNELKEHRLDVPQATLVADELRSAGRTDSTGNPYEERTGGCDYVRGKCLDKDMRTGRR